MTGRKTELREGESGRNPERASRLMAASILAIAISLGGCGDDPGAMPAAQRAPESAAEGSGAPDARGESQGGDVPESPPGEPLFVPLNEAHRRSLEANRAENEAIEARIEAAAREREKRALAELREELIGQRERYRELHGSQISDVFAGHRRDLDGKYLAQLKEVHGAAVQGGRSLLAEQLVDEAGRVKAGERPPAPPREGTAGNPGLKVLFDLRRWYAEGHANLEEARRQSEANLTEAYRQSLVQVPFAAAGEAGEALVRRELESLQGAWWKSPED